jgi:hypothetical protein
VIRVQEPRSVEAVGTLLNTLPIAPMNPFRGPQTPGAHLWSDLAYPALVANPKTVIYYPSFLLDAIIRAGGRHVDHSPHSHQD